MQRNISPDLIKQLYDIIYPLTTQIYIKAKLKGIVTLTEWEYYISEKYLRKEKDIEDIPVAKKSNKIDFDYGSIMKISHILHNNYSDSMFIPSGAFFYPPTGFMSWHTNTDAEYNRLYIVYANESNKSFFRYYDSDSDAIITDYDNAGINIREFNSSKQKPLWHCVGSNCNRFSFGFRKIKKHDTYIRG
jgi:hypothetical protein